VIGLGYDLMNGAVFGSLALLTALPSSSRKNSALAGKIK